MSFNKCPECGETNYQERNFVRAFDCGFSGEFDRRAQRCDRTTSSRLDEENKYRLALLDAAQVAETIGTDMKADGIPPEYAQRCIDLSRQLREFAGHTIAARTFDDLRQSRGVGNALVGLFRKKG